MTWWQTPLRLDSRKPVQYWFRYVLEKYGDFGVFRGAELHRCVRCLAMDGDLSTVILSSSFYTRYSFELSFQCHRFEVNQHPLVEVMSVLLNSGQSVSGEEAVEKRNVCRSMQTSSHRSIWMSE
ncbi:hypothetical protein DY000_02049217 [Brassica cretica]|uniref:Uncharacterized protein n=1 Tax=Brassica cretica TaxID=69181 RepID=A0ABQ7EZZ4_BRACR|nr:hypothetical protein DY000_02049217 [Brassica cretica]